MTSEVFTHALSTLLKKGSHLIEILQAIVFIWLHTCLPFRTNQFTWGVFNNVSNGGTLDVLVPGFTHCKYVALSTNAHLVEHALSLKFHWPTQIALKAMWKPTLPFLTSVHLTYTTPPLNSSSQPIPYLYPILPPNEPYPTNPTLLHPTTLTPPRKPYPSTLPYIILPYDDPTALTSSSKPYPNPRHLPYPILPDLHYTSLHHPILP